MAEHELKYAFPAVNSGKLIQWLMHRCDEDGAHPKGIISSVYYDSLDWNFLDEKINSDYLKTKFRLRWYQDTETHAYSARAYFEKKQKIGNSRKKKRVELDLHDAVVSARHLNEPYFTALPNQVFSQDLLPVRAILPVFQISYTRHRFVDPLSGARLAVDCDIHVPRINPSMVRRYRGTSLKLGVFECKGNRLNLPEWLNNITLFGCRKNAFSKYSNCFTHISGLPV